MRSVLAKIKDSLQTRLWPIPMIAVVFALVLGVALPQVEANVDAKIAGQAGDWLFGGDADAARSLLGVIASSLITVTALTFSLTVVTLQLASSQFSPRLLRTFTRDQFVQATLALFLGTFTYALTVLRAVRSASDGQVEFVPKIAVSLAFVAAIASVVGLVLFLAHLTEQIRVETMLRTVHRDATKTMEIVLPEPESRAERFSAPARPGHAVGLLAYEDGFLTSVDHHEILAVAEDCQVVLTIDVVPGRFLVAQTPLGAAWSLDGTILDVETVQRIRAGVADCIHTGFERTATEDVAYGLRQLTDVANKALSPGINDPTTAIHALGRISGLLCSLTDRHLAPALLLDGQDRVRVVLRRPDFADYVDLGISQPRRYGASDPQVLERIFQVLLDLSHRANHQQHAVIRAQLERLQSTVSEQNFDSTERSALKELGQQIEKNLDDSR